jgi:Protein of unknown function (DUF3604)
MQITELTIWSERSMQNNYRFFTIDKLLLITLIICATLFTGCLNIMDVTVLPKKHLIINNYFVFYGSFHNHSDVSDGTGSPEEAYSYARDTADLDFFGLSDHDSDRNDSNWNLVKQVAERHNVDGVFTTFWGFEWSNDSIGHITVVNTDTFCMARQPETSNLQQLNSWLDRRNCFAILNHPGIKNGYGMEFDHFNSTISEKIVGMELWNKSEEFSVFYYNDGYDSNDNNKGFYDEALTHKLKIGAAGGFDNHGATWGTSADYRLAILATNLTREHLFSAMKARRFYSTLDKNIALSFTVKEQEMGSTVSPGTSTLHIRASDGDNEAFSEVVLFDRDHNVRRIWQKERVNVDIVDTLHTGNDDYYYVKVREVDGDEAISSPIWVSN